MLRCPKCRHEFNLLEASAEDDWREIIRLLPAFGTNGRLVFEYCELFGVTPLRVKAKKLFRLLNWMARLFEEKKFTFQKREYSISGSGIQEALSIVCNRHFDTPLTEHNYLKKVMIGIAERETKERNIKREKELRRKEQRQERHTAGDGRTMSAEEFKRRQGIESLAGIVGKYREKESSDE